MTKSFNASDTVELTPADQLVIHWQHLEHDVRQMRLQQRKFLRARSMDTLREVKRLEAVVDNRLDVLQRLANPDLLPATKTSND